MNFNQVKLPLFQKYGVERLIQTSLKAAIWECELTQTAPLYLGNGTETE
jgi:hypothetical protein